MFPNLKIFQNEQILSGAIMSNRNWTPDQREDQSKLIMEQTPWDYSTGPQTLMGKFNSKMNALKHGFNTESLREFRKSDRRTEVRELENLCKELIKRIKTDDFEKVLNLSDQIDKSFRILSEEYEIEGLQPELQIENFYTTIVLSKTLFFSIQVCFTKLRASVKEQVL